MNSDQISTYRDGPVFRPTRAIAGQELIDVCTKLSHTFNQRYGSMEYLFEPEPISEGGIKWISWPGKTATMYKTMRIHFTAYPRIPMNDPASVIDSRFTIPYSGEPTGCSDSAWTYTCLKAFRGAPAWTAEDLDMFIDALATLGMVLNPTRNGQTKLCRPRDAAEIRKLKVQIAIHRLEQQVLKLGDEIRELKDCDMYNDELTRAGRMAGPPKTRIMGMIYRREQKIRCFHARIATLKCTL